MPGEHMPQNSHTVIRSYLVAVLNGDPILNWFSRVPHLMGDGFGFGVGFHFNSFLNKLILYSISRIAILWYLANILESSNPMAISCMLPARWSSWVACSYLVILLPPPH